MRAAYLLPICLVLLIGEIESIPVDGHSVQKRVNNLPVIPAGDDDVKSLTQLKTKRWKLVPVEVKQIESYEHKDDKAPATANKEEGEVMKKDHKRSNVDDLHSFSRMSSSHQHMVNNNGNIQANREDNQQVSQDGQLMSAFRHRGDALAPNDQPPHYKSMTEVDVPWLNLHEKVLNQDGLKTNLKEEADKKSSDTEKTIRSLVEYIEQTGDDATVASFLESLVKEDKLSEAEALMYVEGVEGLLEKDREIEEMLDSRIREVEKEEEREDEAELILNLSDYLDLKYKSGKINKQAYDDLKGRLMETVLDIAREDPEFLSAEPNSQDQFQGPSSFF